MRKQLLVAIALMGMTAAGSLNAYADEIPQQQSQDQVTITGSVLDENNDPVIGANVSLRGNKKVAVNTDFDGNFKIQVPKGSMLEINYIGYKSESAAAKEGMIVYLQPTTEQLDQLVVVGYGTQKKANLTGAVATVDVARVMDSRPVQDVTKALQGTVPGLTITNTNGGIDSEASINIRGIGTMSNGQTSNPLIVVDGVPTNDLTFVNPEDIQEISVLKDAASSSIYGSRAAFGVILITTKSANRKDKVSLTYTNNFAWSKATVLPDFAKSSDQIDAALQSYARTGTGASAFCGAAYSDLLPYVQAWEKQHNGRYTDYRELQPFQSWDNVGDYIVMDDGTWLHYADWDIQELMFNNAAPSQKHNLGIEGTSGKTKYRISLGYDSKQGLMNFNPDKMKRYMANATVSTEIFPWLKAGARMSFSQREYTYPYPSRNAYQYMWRWQPYNEMYGYLVDEETGEVLPTRSEIMNRTQGVESKRTSRQTRMQGWLDVNPIKGLNIHADFTYDIRQSRANSAWGLYRAWNTWSNKWGEVYQSPTAGQPSTDADKSAADRNLWTANLYATYDITFKDAHNLKVMLGTNSEKERYDYFFFENNGLVDYSLPVLGLTDGGKDGTQNTFSSSDTHRATAGFFGRINYDYKGIYLLELNGRYDGSSRFPANDQWAFFPSVSAGYRFTEEPYFKKLRIENIVSNGKIRASYGEIGNEAIGNNMFLSTISKPTTSTTYSFMGASGTLINYAGTPTLVSSSLTWERICTTDIGIDLGFLNNSLNLTFDWFNRLTRDMLAPGAELPSVLGTSAPYENTGRLRTNGWELSLSWNHSFGDADVYATFSIGDARTKITKWENKGDDAILYTYRAGSNTNRYYEGQTFGDVWGLEFDRFFTEDDFVGKDANGNWILKDGIPDQSSLEYGSFHFGPGDVKYKDLDGDGVISVGSATKSDHGDAKVIGNALPRYEYSFRLGGSWKGFDLDLFFQGVGKRKYYSINQYVIPLAQSADALYSNQVGNYNRYILDDAGQIVGYDIDQNNFYPGMYVGCFGYNSRYRNLLEQGTNNFTVCDRYLTNMAYLRLKTLTVGYTLPANITMKALIQRARVYFSAENPFFIYNGASKYNMDPELFTGESGQYSSAGVASFGRTSPMMKSYSFGIQVTF